MKGRYAAAFSIAAAMAAQAHAQSTVTLYGIVDLGLQYANSAQTSRVAGVPQGKSQFAMTDAHSTGMSGSRWGLRGAEDLGGGLKAIFALENGFLANTGALAQGGAEFGRQAWVGISSPWGTVTAGRQYDPLVNYVQQFAASGTFAGYMGSHPDDLDNLTNTNRINNSIKYESATYGGFKASALYSFGGVAGSVTQNQIWGLGAGYTGTSFAAGVGYMNARDPNVSFYGNTPNKGTATANNIGSAGSATSPESNPVYAGYASAKTLQIIGGGASYNFGSTTVSLVGTNVRFESLGSSSGPNPLGYTGDAIFTSIDLNARYWLTPSLQFGAGIDYTHRNSVKGDDGAKYLQLDLGVDYNLSKRTDLYALTVLQRAMGRDSLGQPAVASIAGFSPSSTDKQVGVRLGIRHKF
ncbi:porin [Caballeronia pedi]|uniref:Porin n=1 Tax=Caballeronia pedi TaxID=1777141 RepID=A0A158DKC5_9BURK|nr:MULTISPECIES: porin [Burkholderiaceae]BBU33516.1 porin [Burkholderia sp. THE68]SAK94923.1 porin [Caballeronia pedi]